MIKSWISDLNTTSFRIVWSVYLVAFCVITIVFAMLVRDWKPDPMQMKVLMGIAGGLLTMMGFDVLQFASKRFSNAEYAAAKFQGQQTQVNVAAPSTVKVDGKSNPVEIAGSNVGITNGHVTQEGIFIEEHHIEEGSAKEDEAKGD